MLYYTKRSDLQMRMLKGRHRRMKFIKRYRVEINQLQALLSLMRRRSHCTGRFELAPCTGENTGRMVPTTISPRQHVYTML